MPRFLVAWEFGEDLGHVRRMLPVARALRRRGHEVALAFRDAAHLATPAREGFAAWPAPVLRRPATFDPAPINAADLLLNLGFRDAASLRGVQRAWDGLLDATRPDVVVGDYAPNAMLAAKRRGLRRATLGSGFALPPARVPLPAIRPSAHGDHGRLHAVDTALRESVARAVGGADAGDVIDLFRGDENLLLTWPELDPLGPRAEDYLGPMASADEGAEAVWDDTPARRVLAYLKPRDARFRGLLQALEASGAQVIVAAPGMLPEHARAQSSPRVRIFATALRLSPLLCGIDLCVGHGGAGFAAEALRAGTPLFLLPMHLEQELVARRLVATGVAAMHRPEPAASIEAQLAAALADRALHDRARAFARSLAARTASDPALDAAARLEALAR